MADSFDNSCRQSVGDYSRSVSAESADANHLKILLGIALLLVTLLMELNFVPEVKNKKLGRVSAGF